MLAGNEVSDRPPQCFINGDDRRTLHQMLDRRDRLRITRMQIEISVPDGVRRPAATTHQPARAGEQMVGRARSASAVARSLKLGGGPSGIGCLADSTLEYRKDVGN